MPGAQCTRSLVCAGVVLVCTPVFTAEAPDTSGIPHAMVLRLIRDLPGDEFLFATVAPRIEWHLEIPVGPRAPPRGLASATDARTTRLRRTLQRRSSARCVITHELSPALRCNLSRRRCRVHRIPASRVVTIAIRPSCECGIAEVVNLIWVFRKAIYFSREGWTGIRNRCPSGKSLVRE
jgi:hypothetical protein